jgi:hypothetical protein
MVRTQWYFLCECEAKWFADKTPAECPRCGRTVYSGGKQIIPWEGKSKSCPGPSARR